MAIQTATTGNLEKASNVLIGEARFTAEYNSPCINLVERHQLGKGENTYRFIKFGQAEMSAVADGEDIIESQEFGMTYVDCEPTIVGAKFIISDKAMRELKPAMMAVAGRMLGDGMGRKRDEDIIALFVSLDNAFGATTKYLGIQNAQACVSNCRDLKIPNPIYVVAHPNALGYLAQSAMAIGATYYAGLLDETTRKILNNFWRGVVINNVPFFDDGNIPNISGYNEAYGAIFSKYAMGVVESLSPRTETDRDASASLTELVITSDYIAVEIDGGYGASLRYMSAALATNN